jgi:type IV secretory pathway VirB2 component (pilin)
MKKIVVSLCIICLLFSFFACSFPNVSSAIEVDKIKSKFKGGSGSATGISTGKNAIQNIVGTILDIVRTIGATVAVVILMIIAGKYMIASAGDRADIKKYAVNYIIGALILFSASALLGMVKDVVDKSIK